MSQKISLPNGNSMSIPSVNPKNWKSRDKTLLTKPWMIQYYFYERNVKKGRLISIRGMNSYKDLKQRQEITQFIMDIEMEDIKKGYNPIIKKMIKDTNHHAKLSPSLFFIDAFRKVLPKIQVTEKHKKEVESCITRLEKNVYNLGLQNIEIKDLKRRQIRHLLEACDLPSNYYNKYVSIFSSLFSQLVEYECCEINIMRDIRKRKIIKTKREVLTAEDRDAVMSHLYSNYYEFWRYAQIFLYSGARTTELFRVQAKHVDIKNQEYKTTIMKGGNPHEVIKVILKEVIPLWKELLDDAGDEDYLFSKGLLPGVKPIRPYQITKRWLRLVKQSKGIKGVNDNKLEVTADFYSLKHSFLDSLPQEMAMLMASHTNSKTTSIYRVNEAKRQLEKLKALKI